MGKKTKIGIAAVAVGAAAWAGSKAIATPQVRPGKKVLTKTAPAVLAHRGGCAIAPEHSLAAFSKSAELGVDGFEVDIRLTKDEEIIVFHDEFLDRTTDGAGRVADLTLTELRKLDLGYRFEDEKGNNPYRGKGESIMTLAELIEKFPGMWINIDMKDSPETYEGSLTPSKLWRLIDSLGIHDQVVVTSFYDEQIDRFNLYAQNSVALGAGENEVRRAYAAFNSQFGHLYRPKADVFQIPVKSSMFRLDLRRFIAFLENLNIPVHYWTIDQSEEMQALINAGAKGIITGRPDVAVQVKKDIEIISQ